MKDREDLYSVDMDEPNKVQSEREAQRARCRELVELLPLSALAEAQEELKALREHYEAIARAQAKLDRSIGMGEVSTTRAVLRRGR